VILNQLNLIKLKLDLKSGFKCKK